MKTLLIRWLGCLCSLLLLQSEVKGDGSLFTAQTVANAFGYNGQLQITANHSSTQGQVNGQLFWSNIYTAPDNSFVPTVITLAAGKAILSDQLQAKLSAMSAQQSNSTTGAPPTAEAIQLDDGSQGYAFLSGFGAGGSGYCAIITSADGKYDLVVKMSFPGNGEPIKQTAANQEYLARVLNRKNPWSYFKTVLNKLGPVASQEYTNLQSSGQNGSASTTSGTPPSPASAPFSPSNPAPAALAPTSQAPAPQTSSVSQTGIPIWLYGLGALGFAVLIGAWFFLKSRN
jgi:hypothetical protein